jgi:hypothetical protein
MKKPLVRAICWTQIYLLAAPSFLLAAAESESSQISSASDRDPATEFVQKSSADPEVIAAQEKLSAIIKKLEESGENENPPKSRDEWHLTNQYVSVFGKTGPENFDLSSLNFNIPALIAANFDRDVQPAVDAETKSISLELRRDGKLVAKHVIEGFRPIGMARDKELLTFLDASGKLYALDMAYAFNEAFKTPLPVVELVDTKLPPVILDTPLNLRFLSRGVKPVELPPAGLEIIQPIDSEIPLTAGDLVIVNSSNQLLGRFDRSVIYTQLYTAEAVLAMLSFTEAPGWDADKQMNTVLPFQEDKKVRESTVKTSEEMSPAVRETLMAIPSSAVTTLVARAHLNKDGKNRERDKFALEEWQSSFEELKNRATSQLTDENHSLADHKRAELFRGMTNEDLRTSVQDLTKDKIDEMTIKRSLLYRFMSSSAMRSIAQVTKYGSVGFAMDRLALGGQGFTWAVHMANEMYRYVRPEPLTNAAYTVLLIKSSLALGSFIGLVYGLGKLKVKYAKTSWSAIKGAAANSFRIFASLQLPFIHGVAKLARQPNFILAMRQGLSPLKHGLTNPLSFGESRKSTIEKQREAISAAVEQTHRVRSLAWTLALLAASEKSGVDPATISAAMENESLETKALQSLESVMNPNFGKKWAQAAEELYFRLAEIKETGGVDVADIDPKDLATYYRMASEVVTKIQSRGRLAQIASSMKLKWQQFRPSMRAGISNFGLEEYKFLKSAEPGDFVTRQFWKQFVVDYLLCIVQMGLYGARARLSDPQALAASSRAITLWTNPGHLADMVDQVRVYGLNVPARMALVYQRSKPIMEGAYDPIENLTLQARRSEEGKLLNRGQVVEKSDGFYYGLGQWVKGAVNIRKADYGNIWRKTLIRQIKTIQVSFLMIMFSRLVMAHQSPYDSLMAFIYTMIWSNWQYGWLWDPITRGNQIYGERLEEAQGKFAAAKTNLGRALRLDDEEGMLDATKSLLQLYREAKTEFPPEVEKLLREENFSKTLSDLTENSSFASEFKMNLEVVANLRLAISSGDIAKLEEARNELLALYEKSDKENAELGEVSAILRRLNAVSLLAYSLKHPPFETSPHPLVEWSSTIFGAVVTTYWGASMSVLTFRENVSWGEKIAEAGLASGILYAGTYYGQKLLNNYPAIKARVKRRRIERVNDKTKVIVVGRDGSWDCKKLLSGLPSLPQ